MKSKLPNIVNVFLTKPGWSAFDLIFSPRLDQTIIARIPPLVVIVDIVNKVVICLHYFL